MFRKFVSSVPFSPALAGQLGIYARRLGKEHMMRRLGLICTSLALVVQTFVVFNPPEQALANTSAATISNGVSSVEDITKAYDADNKSDFKALLNYFGISRSDLDGMDNKIARICSSDHSIVSIDRAHHYSSSEGELTHRITTPERTSTFYSVPLYRFDEATRQTNCYDAYVGTAEKLGWFAIMTKTGNLQIKQTARQLPHGRFIDATCSAIQGFAYDERITTKPVKVYVFIGGLPGNGEQYGPFLADDMTITSPQGTGHGFKIPIPDKYRLSNEPLRVWGVMQPLSGWTEPTVHFDNTVTIPAHCATDRTPTASCDTLTVGRIERDKVRFQATASAAYGASIKSYQYVVDKDGKQIASKAASSAQTSNTSEVIQLKDVGTYNVKVTVNTSAGDKQSAYCATSFSVSPSDKCQYAPLLAPNSPDCEPCATNTQLWAKDENCISPITLSKEARNLSQNDKDANSTTLNSDDRIQFDLHTTNVGLNTTPVRIEENLTDVLEYATLIDMGGGTFDATTKTISWGTATIEAGKSDTRSFVVQIKATIPSTPQAANDPAAYDCVITNSYGNTINLRMPCPLGKTLESTIKQLPATNPIAATAIGALVLAAVSYLSARSRMLNREIRIIRRIYNA